MSAPETDPFYDALRNRLHDYEEPLPAGGWAGIAPQLTSTPPPPRPTTTWWQRAPKRRLAALILLLVLPTITLLWWRDRAGRVAARRQPAPAVAARTERAAPSSSRQPAAPLAAPARKPQLPATQVAAAAETAPQVATAPRRLQPGVTGRRRAQRGVGAESWSAATTVPSRDSATQVAAAKPARPLALTTKRQRAARTWEQPESQIALNPTRPGSQPASAAEAQPTTTGEVAARSAATRTGPPTATGATVVVPGTPAPAKPATGSTGATTSPPTTVAVVPALLPAPQATRPVETASPSAAATTPEPPATTTSAAAAPENAPAATAAAAAEAGARTAAASTAETNLTATVPTAAPAGPELAWLTGLTSPLRLPGTPALPTPLPAPAGPRDSLRRRAARLSLGLLVGAATARRGAGSVPTRLRTLEDPDYGTSAEVAARYFFTPSLGLRTGLGYAEQRQQLALTVEKRQQYWAQAVQIIVRSTPTGPDTLRVLGQSLRDSLLSKESRRYQLTQRYLTLPLLAEWRPRIPFRWQPVLSLGATANWLLSGSYLSTTNGCNCEQQTQRRGGAGPFAPTSVALSAGLGLDYALSLRTTLLLRPTAQYWLTPTGRGGATRPLSAGLQLGLLFDSHRP